MLIIREIQINSSAGYYYTSTRMAVLAQAATTKYHRLGVLSNRHLFLTVLEAGKFNIKRPADWVSDEGPLSDL